MNLMMKKGIKHSSAIDFQIPEKTYHGIFIEDATEFLKRLPSSSVQLVLIDPPYNLDMASWDTFNDYMEWAKQWLNEIERILTDNGNFVIFGGYQYQDSKKGDLLEIMHYLRHNTKLLFVNLIIWYYKTGMGAHRFFSNRHEEILWYGKTKKYYFDLDSVHESIEKGKNPTNVWSVPRLNANSFERVGHPTQKPLEVIRRLVKGLSYPSSIVLDFFAGSGTTGRVCIEEKRHSVLVDNDEKTIDYFNKHLNKMWLDKFTLQYEILKNPDLEILFEKFKE
jgi:site-specific DNA-methyltransferase (adenine-specific)